MKEVWKKVPTLPQYELSNLGRIQKHSVMYTRQGKLPTASEPSEPRTITNTRQTLWDAEAGKNVNLDAKKFIAEAFVDNPKGYNYVKLIDKEAGFKASNLMWYKRYISIGDVLKYKALGYANKDIARRLGVEISTVQGRLKCAGLTGDKREKSKKVAFTRGEREYILGLIDKDHIQGEKIFNKIGSK